METVHQADSTPSLLSGAEAAMEKKISIETAQDDTCIRIMVTMASADEAQLLRWLSGLQRKPDRTWALQMPKKLAARIGFPHNWLQCAADERGTLLRNCHGPVVFIPRGACGPF